MTNPQPKLFQTLQTRAQTLPIITDYFHGTPALEIAIPGNVIVFGRSGENPPLSSPIAHHRYLLVINLKGGGSAILDAVRHFLPPDHCLLIFPHQHHHFLRDNREIAWIFITFELSKPGSLTKLRNRALRMSPVVMEYLELLTRDLTSVKRLQKEPGRMVLLTALLLDELLRVEPDTAGAPLPLAENHRFVDAVNQYLQEHLHDNLNVAKLARQFALSPSHFRAKYRAAMGIGIGRYAHSLRINRAQGLLHGTDMRIGEVADACGYVTAYAFSHAFKNAIGKSPLAYRKGGERNAPRSRFVCRQRHVLRRAQGEHDAAGAAFPCAGHPDACRGEVARA